MRKSTFTLLGILFSCFLAAQQYTGTYTLEMKLDMPDTRYEYNKSEIILTDNKASIEFDFKMDKQETAKTNYILVSGSGSGSITGDRFDGTGTSKIQIFEKGVMDTEWNSTFSMTGKHIETGSLPVIEGTFSFVKDGKPINGTFKATREAKIWLTYIRGNFTVLRSGGTDWIKGADGMNVTVNDKIKTEDNTRVELNFTDGSLFRIKSNTILTLMAGGIQLQLGESWFNLQKQGTTFQVVTPTAVCGVLGTEFIVSVQKSGETNVGILRGQVSVKDKQEKEIILEAGQSLDVTAVGVQEVKQIDVADVAKTFEDSDNPSMSVSSGFIFTNKILLYGGGGFLCLIILILILVRVSRKAKNKKSTATQQQVYQQPENPAYRQTQATPPSYVDAHNTVIQQPPVASGNVNPSFCQSCGNKLKPNAKFCAVCGQKLI
ncbi:MAG: FecR domain-containing protein [Bacteroidales bacterium]